MMSLIFGSVAGAAALAWAFWRYVWFFRNPYRTPPPGDTVLSPADGTVVYVRTVPPKEKVISVKNGAPASIEDIARTNMENSKIHIGIFMSPFNVHYNRAPISGTIGYVCHHSTRGRNLNMARMHLQEFLRRQPYQQESPHVVQNERRVTRIDGRFKGALLHCYVVQIAARRVNGIDGYREQGRRISRGAIFGMIRIGSQVDLILPCREGCA